MLFNIYLRILLSSLLVFYTYSTSAQKLILKQYSPSDGLPSSLAYSVFQDSKGYIWFATDAGICRYDGSAFKTYSARNGLTDNTVFNFFEDHKQRLWLRTISGKLSYLENDKVISLPCNSEINRLMGKGVVASVYVDSKDTLWLGLTINDECLKIAPPYKRVECVKIFDQKGGRYILPIEKGFIFGVSRTNVKSYSLWFNPLKSASTYFTVSKKISDSPSPIACDIGNGEYLISIENCLYRLSKKGAVPVKVFSKNIISIMKDSDRNIWVGCINEGLYKLPADSTKATEHYFNTASVTQVLEDKEHGFWFSTLNDGVFYCANIKIRYHDEEDGLCKEPLSVCAIDRHSIAVGGQNILCIIKDGNITSFNIPPPEASTINQIHQLAMVGKDTLVIGGKKMAYLIRGTGKFHWMLNNGRNYYSKKFSCNGADKVYCTQHDCIASHELRSGNNARAFELTQRAGAIYARADKVWLSTANGLLHFNGKSLEDWSAKDPLLRSRITDIKPFRDGTLLLVTRDTGLLLLKGDKVSRINNSALPDAMFSFALLSGPDKIWLTSNTGLYEMQVKEKSITGITNYNTGNGLLSNEVYQVAQQGELLYATCKKGLMVMFPGFNRKNNYAPPVYLSNISINEKEMPLLNTFKLEHDQNRISIQYHAICFKGKDKLVYRYRLSKNDNWIYTRSAMLNFPQLAPGNYHLQIQAKGPDGIWNTSRAVALNIMIDKPFWLKWWFFTLVGLLLISSTYLILKSRYDSLLKIEKQQTLMNKRLAEMQLSKLRTQMNPHFIFNAINSIQSFIIKNENRSARKYLNIFSKILRNILEQSESDQVALSEEIYTLTYYLEIEALRFDDLKFNIEISDDIDAAHIIIPGMLIQPYVENAVWHGLMHKQGYRALNIKFEMEGEQLHCIIEDNGIGRKKSTEINAGKTKAKSFGMNITGERLEILNQQMNNISHITITDKYDQLNEPTGTKVEIVIPIKEKYDTKHNN